MLIQSSNDNNENDIIDTKVRYDQIDAYRGIAAIIVLLFHLTIKIDESKLGFNLGSTGVDFFFIISGFVIFNSLNNCKNESEFIINRISRLYPTYWAAATITMIAIFVSIVVEHGSLMKFSGRDFILFPRYIINLTMLQNYFGISDLDGPYWTLRIELQFYTIMFFFLIFHKLRLSIIVFTILSLIYSFLVYFNSSISLEIFTNKVLPYTPLFLAGILFNHLKNKKNQLKFALPLLLIAFFCQLINFPILRCSHYINQPKYIIMLSIYFILFILFTKNIFSSIANKTTKYLGKISYSLYLVHQFIILNCLLPLLHNYLGLSFIKSSIISIAVTLIIADLITNQIELKYSQKLKEKLKSVFQIR